MKSIKLTSFLFTIHHSLHWMGFCGMAAGSLDGFLRHGHWVGFRGMAAGSLDGVTGLPLARVLEDFRGGGPIMEHSLHPCGVKDAKNSNYCITPT